MPMIAGEIRRFLRDNSPIRVSRSVRDTAYRVLQAKEQMTSTLGREPGVEEIAKELEISVSQVNYALDAISVPVSLQEPLYGDSGDPVTALEQVGDEKSSAAHWVDRIALKDAIATLNSREKQILALRYYEGRTQMEVAQEVGISQAQVSRLEKAALNTMRKSFVV